jgi:hypothetical protein
MGRIGIAISLSFALFGCGSVKDSGGAIDGSIDTAPGVDADLSGNATVVTEAALFGGTIGANVGNIDIISMLPNNTVLEMKQTDAGGNATIKVYPGGTVTAVYKHTVDMGADLITFAGVKPGDTLTFGSRNFSTSGQANTNIGTQSYSWPAFGGATFYDVFTSCSSGFVQAPALSTAVTESSLCHKEPMDVIFMAETNTGYTAFAFRSNVAFVNGQNVANSGWSTLQQATVNISGLPPEITSLSGNFAVVMDGNRELNFVSSYNGTPTGGAFTANFNHTPMGERILGRVNLGRPGFNSYSVMDSFAPNTLSQTVAAPALPAPIQSNAVASSGLRMATWFPVPDASSVTDGIVLRLTWNHVVSATNHPHQWHIIMPPTQASINLPKLPSQFTDNLPFANETLGAVVRSFDVSAISNYDAVRMTPSRNIMCIECALRGGDFTHAAVSGGTVN